MPKYSIIQKKCKKEKKLMRCRFEGVSCGLDDGGGAKLFALAMGAFCAPPDFVEFFDGRV